MINFSHTIFYVKDIAAIISFYEKAFGFKPKFVHESGSYVELETGSTALAFADETLGLENLPNGYLSHDPKQRPFGFEIVFTVKDVPACYEQALLAGAEGLVPPKEKPWGQIVAYVRDPSGVLIEIASIMDPDEEE